MNQPTVIQAAPGVQFCAVRAQRFKTSRLLLQMALPLQIEEPKQNAANAILPFILHRSSAEYPKPRALESRLAELYGARLSAFVQKQGEAQFLSIALTALDDRFALNGDAVSQGCANLLLDLLFSPNLKDGFFSAESVAMEKRLLIEKLESQEGNKWLYASNRCDALMCSREAYGLNPLGEKDDIAALTPEDITQAWTRALTTAPMQLTMVADSDGAAVLEDLTARFVGLERNPVMPQTVFIATAGEEKFIREEQPIEQAKLFIGMRAGIGKVREKHYPLWVMCDLFGGGPYSKLFTTVREKMSLCYTVRASFMWTKGLVVIRSGVDTDKAAQAQAAILEQLRLIQAGEFTDEELDTCIRSLCDANRTLNDTPEDVAGWYATGLYDGVYTSPEEECEHIAAVTREEVVAAARGLSLDTVYLLAASEKEAEQ